MSTFPACNDDILDPTLIRTIIGSINYFVSMLFGNTLLIGIIDFEHWGGDPMRRTVLNQLTSLACGSILVLGTLTGSIYQWIVITGPSGPNLAALLVIGRHMSTFFGLLAVVEHILIRCLVLYKRQNLLLVDDFVSRFLFNLNLTVCLLFGFFNYMFDRFRNGNYALLTCRESGPSPRFWLVQSSLVFVAACGYAAIKYKKKKLRDNRVVPFNDMYNSNDNAPVMSTGQIVINATGLYAISLPFFILAPAIFPGQGRQIVMRYREIIALYCTNIIFPSMVYYKNKNLRNHMKERLTELYLYFTS